MPAEGTDVFEQGDVLTYEETKRIIALAAGMGISRFRFTGESRSCGATAVPGRVKKIPGVETWRFRRTAAARAHAEGLRDAGVDKINISIDSFDRAIFAS